ncbi:MAG: hypothetical protein KGI90_14860 [Burkholderiales bacterium]|nr:hypothetical protein [Burkholderiales bacterium]MDE2275928.1 hypothetical protein [Burkholderiales bacterium]
MHAAPPVSVQCDGGAGWRVLQTALPALAAFALGCLAAGWAGLAPMPTLGSGLAASLVLAVIAWRQAAPRPVRLAWDGQAWSADGDVGALAVMLDLGPWLLLRLDPKGGGRRRWIALAAHEAGAALQVLRAALYSRAPDATPRVSATRVPD